MGIVSEQILRLGKNINNNFFSESKKIEIPVIRTLKDLSVALLVVLIAILMIN